MLKNFGVRSAFVIFAVAAAALSFSPVTQATPVKYDFSVNVTQSNSLVLKGSTTNGNFSYDSNSVVVGGNNKATNLFTAFDFTFNGITYDATTANTGLLKFDSSGNLASFLFGSNCTAGRCTLLRSDSFLVSSEEFKFFARTPGNAAGTGNTIFALAPVSVPEPGTLGLFGLGVLMLGLFAGTRRRMC